MAAAGGVQVGDLAPDFNLTAADGQPIRLSDFRGRSNVVLFFYPKNNTTVCTAEACAFRDSYEVFREAGAEVIGVSGDSDDSHQQFAAQHRLPFHLLSDPSGQLRALYGVPKTLWLIPGRVTYLIDRQGVVRHMFSRLLAGPRHVEETLRFLQQMSATA